MFREVIKIIPIPADAQSRLNEIDKEVKKLSDTERGLQNERRAIIDKLTDIQSFESEYGYFRAYEQDGYALVVRED